MEGKETTPSTAPPPAERTSPPSPDKAQLECEKLKAEIESIRKPFWRTTAFYSGVAPAILAALGLLFTYSSGWFDVQRTRLSNEKTLLEAQTERLRTERTTLESQTREQQTRFARAEEEIQMLKQRESELTNQLAKLGRERDDLRLAKELLETETKRLAGSETKASQFLDELKSMQQTREDLLVLVQALETSNTTLRAVSGRQVALIRWANAVLSEAWSTALKDKATWTKFQDLGTHVLKVHAASTQFLPEYQVDPDPPPISQQNTPPSYNDDIRTETMKAISQASKKTYEDYIREANERFDLLTTATSNKTTATPPTTTR